jgi:hypothetical protein
VTDVLAGDQGFEPQPHGLPPAEPGPADADSHDPEGVDDSIEAAAAAVPVRAHLATAEELEDWDVEAVASANGHVFQSRAWADFHAGHGRRTWHVAFDDGFRVLVLGRPGAGGPAGAYASRGPIPEADPTRTAARARAVADLLADQGVPALVVDGETPAASGLGRLLAMAGFEPTDEEQHARHRMDVRLGPDDAPNSDEKTIFESFGSQTRHLVRQSERHGLLVARLDAGGGRIEDDDVATELEEFEHVDPADPTARDDMLRGIYGMLDPAVVRRSAALVSEEAFLDWSRRGIAAGHLLYLRAEHPEDGPIAAVGFYRHGHRLTFSLVGARPEPRRKYPGSVRLLVWRAIQIALDERRSAVDLGGVDTPALRRRPDKGDATYGAYQFRESFGARWVELTGAHRRTMRPLRNNMSRVASAALRRLGRLAPGR